MKVQLPGDMTCPDRCEGKKWMINQNEGLQNESISNKTYMARIGTVQKWTEKSIRAIYFQAYKYSY